MGHMTSITATGEATTMSVLAQHTVPNTAWTVTIHRHDEGRYTVAVTRPSDGGGTACIYTTDVPKTERQARDTANQMWQSAVKARDALSGQAVTTTHTDDARVAAVVSHDLPRGIAGPDAAFVQMSIDDVSYAVRDDFDHVAYAEAQFARGGLPAKPEPRRSVHDGGAKAVTPGFYLHGGRVYKVRPAQGGGHLYAMVLVGQVEGNATWEYAKGAMAWLRASDKMTQDQAAEFGRTHGFCAMCGRLLTDPESIQRGIGPVCATKF